MYSLTFLLISLKAHDQIVQISSLLLGIFSIYIKFLACFLPSFIQNGNRLLFLGMLFSEREGGQNTTIPTEQYDLVHACDTIRVDVPTPWASREKVLIVSKHSVRKLTNTEPILNWAKGVHPSVLVFRRSYHMVKLLSSPLFSLVRT